MGQQIITPQIMPGITDVAQGDFTITGTGGYTITTGFKPVTAHFMWFHSTNTTTSAFSHGYWTTMQGNYSTILYNRSRYSLSDRCILISTTGSSTYMSGYVSATSNTGLTVTCDVYTSGQTFAYLIMGYKV